MMLGGWLAWVAAMPRRVIGDEELCVSIGFRAMASAVSLLATSFTASAQDGGFTQEQGPMFGIQMPYERPPARKRYGPKSQHRLLYTSAAKPGAPLAIIVSPYYDITRDISATAELRRLLHSKGFAIAEIGYRNPIRFGAMAVAIDVVSAMQFLRQQSSRLQVDMDRLALIGIGNSAGWAAMVGCNSNLFSQGDLPFSAIRTVALIDGDGVNAPAVMAVTPAESLPRLQKIYGVTADEQAQNSAIGWVSGKNVPDFYMVVWNQPEFTSGVTLAFAEQLRAFGSTVEVRALDGNHNERRLHGQPDPYGLAIEGLTAHVTKATLR